MFQGSLVAIVTPFTPTGKLDVKALRALIEWHLHSKTDGIVCCGTTGESPTLSIAEKQKVLYICLEMAKGKCPVIAGTGTYDTKQSVEMTSLAKELGADGCLVVVPYYNKPTDRGCVLHYREIAKVGLPIIVYHHPGRTGVKLAPSTFAELEKIPSIVAIKEASCNMESFSAIQQATNLPILSGDDSLTIPMMEKGAKGVISVAANILPKEWKEITSLSLEKRYDEAKRLYASYEELVKALFLETNPQCVKYALSLMGKCSPLLRLPLVEPRDEVKEKIQQTLTAVKLI